MNSHPVDEVLALFYGGELSPAEGARVAAHVSQCPKCRATLADFEYSAGLLRTAFADLAGEDLEAIRQSALASVRQRAPSRWLVWVAAAASPAAIVIAIALSLPPKPVPHAEVARVQVTRSTPKLTAPAPALPAVAPVHHHRRRTGAGIRAITLVARGDQPPQLKILTADPNVVIYLQPSGASQIP